MIVSNIIDSEEGGGIPPKAQVSKNFLGFVKRTFIQKVTYNVSLTTEFKNMLDMSLNQNLHIYIQK